MEKSEEFGYRMGVFLCIGQPIHNVNWSDAINFSEFKTFQAIQERLMETDGIIFIFLERERIKSKRKAEQIACDQTIKIETNQLPKSTVPS